MEALLLRKNLTIEVANWTAAVPLTLTWLHQGMRWTWLYQVAEVVIICRLICMLWKHHVDDGRDKSSKVPLPPGGYGVPFLGETITFFRNRTKFYEDRRKKHGNIFKTHILGKPTIRIIGEENLRNVLAHEHCLTEFEWPKTVMSLMGPSSMVAAKGDHFKMRRRAIMNMFEAEAMAEYLSAGQSLVREHLKMWIDQGGDALMYPNARKLALCNTLRTFLGSRFQIDESFYNMLKNFENNLFCMPINLPGSGFSKGMAARRQIQSRLRTHLEETKKRLEAGEEEEKFGMRMILEKSDLSDDEILDCFMELLTGGNGAVASVVTNIAYQLGKNPDIVSKILAELSELGLNTPAESREPDLNDKVLKQLTYVTAVVKEALKDKPPIGGAFRKAAQTFEIGGHQVPAGWTIIYAIKETHDVSPLFESDFRPERWSSLTPDQTRYHYLPFGMGSHACPGRVLAQQFIKTVVVEMVRNSHWCLTGPQPPVFVSAPVPLPVDGLPIRFSSRENPDTIEVCPELN